MVRAKNFALRLSWPFACGLFCGSFISLYSSIMVCFCLQPFKLKESWHTFTIVYFSTSYTSLRFIFIFVKIIQLHGKKSNRTGDLIHKCKTFPSRPFLDLLLTGNLFICLFKLLFIFSSLASIPIIQNHTLPLLFLDLSILNHIYHPHDVKRFTFTYAATQSLYSLHTV